MAQVLANYEEQLANAQMPAGKKESADHRPQAFC